MWFRDAPRTIAIGAVLFATFSVASAAQIAPQESRGAPDLPVYRVAVWPRPLPNHWILGPVCGVAVDSHDHIWIVQRPVERGASVPLDHSQLRTRAAPPVLEFAPDGTLLSSWGGPGPGYDWPKQEHGIYVDRHDNVW